MTCSVCVINEIGQNCLLIMLAIIMKVFHGTDVPEVLLQLIYQQRNVHQMEEAGFCEILEFTLGRVGEGGLLPYRVYGGIIIILHKLRTNMCQ